MAATGGLWGGECYPSQAEALDAFYSSKASVESPGLVTYVVQYVKDSGIWKQQSYQVDGGGVWSLRYSVAAPVVQFPACDPVEGFTDGLAVGWMVAAAIIGAGALKLIQKATG